MAQTKTIKVPDIGDFEEVEVVEVLVSAGDEVEEETPLITLESEKASMDVPCPEPGRVAEVLVAEGDKVSQGDPIIELEPSGGGEKAEEDEDEAEEDEDEAEEDEDEAEEDEDEAEEDEDEAEEEAFRQAYASPGVRRFARELGADLGKVEGTGRKGRITREDVQKWVKGQLERGQEQGAAAGAGIPEIPEVDFSEYGPIEEVKLSKIRRVAARNLHRAWLNVPHVTQQDEADVTELEAFRQELKPEAEAEGIKLTPLAFIVKACVAALKKYPDFNSSLAPDGESLIHKKYYHLGIAVDTPNGLVVPVLRDVDSMGVMELAEALVDLSRRARERKLSPGDMKGGTFSISNQGGIGGVAFTPIVNAPEVAILGISKTQRRPVWTGDGFEPRLVMPLSLSYDHRVIDGAAAARFTVYLADLLTDMRRLVL